MADQHPGSPRRSTDHGSDQVGGGRVQIRAWLVQEEKRGIVEHRAGNGEALNESLGEISNWFIGSIGDLKLV
jgi:hypothetical protein